MDEDQIRVAKLVIVAWIKNFSTANLFNMITEKKLNGIDQIKELTEKYKFLPIDWFWYFGSNGLVSPKPIKKFIADLDIKLNNALWNTEDNVKRLSFATYLAKIDASKCKASSKFSKEDKKVHAKAAKLAKANYLEGAYRKDYGQKMNGTHWGTVK